MAEITPVPTEPVSDKPLEETQVESLDDFKDLTDEEFSKLDLDNIFGTPAPKDEKEADKPTEEIDPEKDQKEVDPNATGSEQDPNAATATQTEEATLVAEDLFKALSAPIKANGKEFTIKTPEEAVRLVQMGLNYSKKMESMNADNVLITALKEQKLFDKNSVNSIIDLMSGNVGAIKKFLADKKIDIDQLQSLDDDETDLDYTPNNNLPSEKYINYKNVAENIIEAGGKNFIIELDDNILDDDSREAIINNPNILQNLHENSVSGVYDIIMEDLQRRKLMNDPQLTGLNFLQQYVLIGTELQKKESAKNKEVQKKVVEVKDNSVAISESLKNPPKEVSELPNGVTPPKDSGGSSNAKTSLLDLSAEELSKLSDEEILKLSSKVSLY